jgi:NitT/TauT family transport system substrate-binding protein
MRRDPGAIKDGKASINENSALEIIAKYTNLPVEQVVGNCAARSRRPDVRNVAGQIEWLQAQVCRQWDLASTRLLPRSS